MKEVFCETCNKIRCGQAGFNPERAAGAYASGQHHLNHGGGAGQDNSAEDFNTNKFPSDYLKKKRLYIVKNLEEINQ